MFKWIKNRIRYDIIPAIVMLFIMCVMLAVIGFGSGDTGTTVVSVLMVLLMCGIMMGAYYLGMKRLAMMIAQLKRVKEWIAELGNTNMWMALRNTKPLFENKQLDAMYDCYVCEMERLYREDEEHVRCDIADYMNEENILESCYGQILEQLPSIMTGLGILGTFIGLALGLSGFDNSGVDQMIASITPLIDGIKVAFFTSIFGVFLSLLFNVYYRVMNGKLVKALDEFYTVYYQNVVPMPGNDLANQVLHYQQSQTKAMQGFAETIADEMAKSFSVIAAPTFESIGRTMETLAEKMEETMGTLSSQISSKQKESMGQIVDTFLSEMNQAMGGSFDDLKESIEQLCSGQQSMQERVEALIEKLDSTVSHVESMNEISKDTLMQMDGYCTKLNGFQTGVNTAYEQIKQQEAMFTDAAKQQAGFTESFERHEAALISSIQEIDERMKSLEETFKSHVDSVQTMVTLQSETIKSMYDSYKEEFEEVTEKQIAMNKESYTAVAEQMRQTSEYLKDSTAQLQKMSNSFSKNMRDSIDLTFEQFDTNLSGIAMHLSGTISEINEVSQNIPRALQGSFAEMQKQLRGYMDVVQEMQKTAQDVTEQLVKDSKEKIAVM